MAWEIWGSIQVESYQRLKNGTYTYLLNTKQYKVHNKGKVEQSPLHPPLHRGVVVIEKGVIGSPSTKVANFTLCSLVFITINNVQLKKFYYLCLVA